MLMMPPAGYYFPCQSHTFQDCALRRPSNACLLALFQLPVLLFILSDAARAVCAACLRLTARVPDPAH